VGSRFSRSQGRRRRIRLAKKTAAASEMMAGSVGRWTRTARPYGPSLGAGKQYLAQAGPALDTRLGRADRVVVLSRLRTWSLSQWGAALVALGMTGAPRVVVRKEPGHRCQCRAHSPGQECECPVCRSRHPAPGSGRPGSPPCHRASAKADAHGDAPEPVDAPRVKGGCSSSEPARVAPSGLPPFILTERGALPRASRGERVRSFQNRALDLARAPETPPPRNG
jgi:hypothetical protein